MFLASISSYAFTLTCLGNYYSRISQMNVNIYQDLHNNRDGDFYIVTYENEGREYVRMVLGTALSFKNALNFQCLWLIGI